MPRRASFWAALTLYTALLTTLLTAGHTPIAAAPSTVSWILLGGKGNAGKAAGLQVYAEPALETSIQLRLNGDTWADGFIVTDDECPSPHFHGRIGDLRERGRGCGLGLAERYDDSGRALQLASDALMSNLQSQNALARAGFHEARDAAQDALDSLLELRELLRVPGPDVPPTRLLALSRVNEAIKRQERAVPILHNLLTQTSNLFAIRRAGRALDGAESFTRRAFVLMAGAP